MKVRKQTSVDLSSNQDVVIARQATRSFAVDAGLGLVDQTKVVTAASELARNTVVYGGGGSMEAEIIERDGRTGVRLTFEDHGPGIPNVEMALKDGFTTGGGLGLGLGGSRRLASEFEIDSVPGRGTRIVFVRWRS